MKKMMMMVVLLVAVAMSYGDVKVDWNASAGFYWDPSFNALLSPGGSTVAQLMYSPDAIQDAGNALTGIGLNGAGYGSGNDQIWGSLTITEDGSGNQYANFNVQSERRAFTSGYVYAMIFQDSAVNAGDWYYYTPIMALVDKTGLALPQTIEMNTDLVNGNAINADPGAAGYGVAQVVPEPATFLLLGVGGVMSLILRRMRAF